MFRFFERHKILICVGSGGVGKTTVSASLGMLAARAGLKVLVLTIDPSKRLKTALGLESGSQAPVSVDVPGATGQLEAMLLDAEAIFKEFVVQSSHREDVAQRLLRNRLYQQLSTTLSGSQEFTSLLQLARMEAQGGYDLIILDTPPAQHAIDFLEAPEKIQALFQENVVRWFLSDGGEVGFFRKVISKSTLTVLSALERITGSLFMTELRDFFESVRAVQGKISDKTGAVRRILSDASTGFVLVTGFDEAKLEEAETLFQYLENRSFRRSAAIINRAFPHWEFMKADEGLNDLAEEYSKWSSYHRERERVFSRFAAKWGETLPTIRIPDLNKDLSGVQGLEVMAHEIQDAFSGITPDGVRSH